MKKSIYIISIGLILLSIGILTSHLIKTYAYEKTASLSISIDYSTMNLFDDSSYELIYLHLSFEQQEVVDTLFATLLLSENIQEKEIDEVIVIVDQIKGTVISDIDINYNQRGYGMMGQRTQAYGSCGFDVGYQTYAWYYLHSSAEQQDLLDLKFAEAIKNLVSETLTVEDVVDGIHVIKQQLIDDIVF
ncbi:MAG: hypothetical protein RBQ71_05420 [Acholeplasmataceae bacterium]|jgi:hypothetical protein|nr:hypothetical protein [Acholeplasmataceae bacterium]